MHRRLFMIVGLALLAGCAGQRPAPILAPSGAPYAELEPLYSAVALKNGITVEVASSGCTAKADFAFHVERSGETVTLAFARRRLDTCRSFAPGRTAINFTYEELGVDGRTPLFLLNPLVAWSGPGA